MPPMQLIFEIFESNYNGVWRKEEGRKCTKEYLYMQIDRSNGEGDDEHNDLVPMMVSANYHRTQRCELCLYALKLRPLCLIPCFLLNSPSSPIFLCWKRDREWVLLPTYFGATHSTAHLADENWFRKVKVFNVCFQTNGRTYRRYAIVTINQWNDRILKSRICLLTPRLRWT